MLPVADIWSLICLIKLAQPTLPAAVQFEELEATCIKYLCDKAQHMTADLLLCLAQLANH